MFVCSVHFELSIIDLKAIQHKRQIVSLNALQMNRQLLFVALIFKCLAVPEHSTPAMKWLFGVTHPSRAKGS